MHPARHPVSPTRGNRHPHPSATHPARHPVSPTRTDSSATQPTRRTHPTPNGQTPTSYVIPSTATGARLAAIARRNSHGDGRHCFSRVKEDLARIGIQTTGIPASGAANQLARNPKVREIQGLNASELPHLPPGAIVVWGSSKKHRYGHISIAGGNGLEYSDRTRRQITGYGTRFRVFMPQDA